MDNARSIGGAEPDASDCCASATNSGWLSRRNVLIAVALSTGAGAIFLGWDWLVAAGLASIIVAMAPCLVMCALGLCMRRNSKSEASVTTAASETLPPDPQVMKNHLPGGSLPGNRT